MAGPCHVCGDTRSTAVLTTPRLVGPLRRCEGCGLLFVEIQDDRYVFRDGADAARAASVSEAIAETARQELHVDGAVEEAERVVRRVGIARRLDLLGQYRSGGRLLEVGCSGGDLLALAADRGYQPRGVEPNRRLAEHASRVTGLEVFPGTLSEAALPRASADAAILLHVIEHLPEPAAELARLREILAPSGVLMVETPNVDNLFFRLGRARWRQIIPEHLWFYSPDTLRRLLEAQGFRVLQIRPIGKDLSLRLFANRLRRVLGPLAAPAVALSSSGWGGRTLYLDARDVMIAVAERT